MRWDNLFDDLEGQLEHELGAEEIDLRAEEERLRLARIGLRDRIAAVARSDGSSRGIIVELVTGAVVAVRPNTFGKDWFAADLVGASAPVDTLEPVNTPERVGAPGRDAQCILPLAAIAAVQLTSSQLKDSLEPAPRETSSPRLADRIGIAFVLRDLCRRRAGVEIHVRTGILHGTIDRVARDHLDLAVHEPGAARRASAVAQLRLLPLDQLCLVRL